MKTLNITGIRMKTFLVSPGGPPHRGCAELRKLLRERTSSCSDISALLAETGEKLRRVLPFDHILYMEPGGGASRVYHVWPPYKGNTRLSWPQIKEADAVILNSYHDTLVRICARGDYATATISVLQKYMREACSDDFSLLFIRKVIQERFIGLIGFISFRKGAYDEKDAATVFALLESFVFMWEKFCRGVQDSDSHIPGHDEDFFSLINLPGMQKVLKLINRVSREDVPVLLLGETGTGKEGVANLIYRGSGRALRPFIKINCGGIPLSLLESKLFGYQKGAFTGALRDTPGCFELADTGSLLLDELGELPLSAQAHLLRVLQEKVIERVGSSLEIPVNVRIIAATNRNLAEMVQRGEFRRDLLYRLSVFPVYIPALRERPEDIPVLLNFFILQQSRKQGFAAPPALARSELRRLCAYSWPGNIREMQNAVIRAMLIWDGARESGFSIEAGANLFAGMFPPLPASVPEETGTSAPELPYPGSLRMEDVERKHILRVLDMAEQQIAGQGGAAEMLGLNPGTLRARMKKLGIRRQPALNRAGRASGNFPQGRVE